MIKLKDLLFEDNVNDTNDTGGVLYYWNDKVLLCLGERSGKWNVPKGHIHINEEPLDGSVREFTEETQIVLNDIPKLENICAFSQSFNNISKQRYLFLFFRFF